LTLQSQSSGSHQSSDQMVQQILPSSHQNDSSIRQPYQTPSYDAKPHCPSTPVPISLAAPTDKQGPITINSPAYSLGPPLLCREKVGLKRITCKFWSLYSFLGILIYALYLCFLLGLPLRYTSRVTKVSNQVNTSMAEIKNSVLEISAAQSGDSGQTLRFPGPLTSFHSRDAPMPLHEDLKHAWDSFIDSLMQEWRMLNVISILVLSAIVAILQIQSAVDDPFTRFSGLLSLICVFISVAYGCVYSIRFDTIRETRKAVEWTCEARNAKSSKFWNVSILLAMPLIWLAWSILIYLVCFLSFVWRTGTTPSSQSSPTVTAHDILGPRITISVIIAVALTCFILILTTFRKYGNAMDDAWNLRVKGWLLEADNAHASRRGGSKGNANPSTAV